VAGSSRVLEAMVLENSPALAPPRAHALPKGSCPGGSVRDGFGGRTRKNQDILLAQAAAV
jgi:hypothetical protein